MPEKRICCQHCGYPIAKDAHACPHCGSVTPIAPKDWNRDAIEKFKSVLKETVFWLFTFSLLWYICKEIVSKIWQ
ncbi:MAG: hypothetical protein IJQ39_02750 [Thermoguttaceae bacterium]|nr:hypothetical protein [Thermoguttaceae bacterium]